jgi:hypothetical protein
VYGGIVKLAAQPGGKSALLEFLRWDADVARGQEPGTLRFVPGLAEPPTFVVPFTRSTASNTGQ